MASKQIIERDIDRAWRVAIQQEARRAGLAIPYRALLSRPSRGSAIGMIVDVLLARIRDLVTQDETNSRQVERLQEALRAAHRQIDDMLVARDHHDAAASLELLATLRDLRRVSNERDDLRRHVVAVRNAQPMPAAPRPASNGKGASTGDIEARP